VLSSKYLDIIYHTTFQPRCQSSNQDPDYVDIIHHRVQRHQAVEKIATDCRVFQSRCVYWVLKYSHKEGYPHQLDQVRSPHRHARKYRVALDHPEVCQPEHGGKDDKHFEE
jgi:hypothetical protein